MREVNVPSRGSGVGATNGSVDGAAEVRQLLNKVAEAGIEARTLTLRQPTLDDVFLTLTSRTA